MTSIAIVAHFAYGAMSGGQSGHVGGVERQTSLVARWLAAKGYHVSLITWNEGQQDDLVIDDVQMIKMCRSDDGFPGLRFIYPRWTSLVKAMRRANADIYYQNCAEYVTGQIALWCKINRRRFIYSVASDPDCDPRLPTMTKLRERILYRYGLSNADRVIVQTRHQQQMLSKGFGLESAVFPMVCPGPTEETYTSPRAPDKGALRVLWVGRIARVKRLEVLLHVAAELPEVEFDVVGGHDTDAAYFEKIVSEAKKLPNVILHDRVPRNQMSRIYESASLLCCTSSYEGFPNTFLEAWSYGLPIVSTVDPDDMISSRRLGITASTFDELTKAIKNLGNNPNDWKRMSENARIYYLENHAVDPVMRRYVNLIQELGVGNI